MLFPSIEREIRNELTEIAHDQAINVFSLNLEQLLLTPPLKNRVILGLDPAFRTGCKLAVINVNGDFIYKDVIYPHEKSVGEIVTDERKEELFELFHLECKERANELTKKGDRNKYVSYPK